MTRTQYQIIVNHPLYRDCPPIECHRQDIRDITDEIASNGVPVGRIQVRRLQETDMQAEDFG